MEPMTDGATNILEKCTLNLVQTQEHCLHDTNQQMTVPDSTHGVQGDALLTADLSIHSQPPGFKGKLVPSLTIGR